MTTHRKTGPFDPDKARQTYEELGPLSRSDLYLLLRQSDKKRRETLQTIYGFHAATVAETEYRKLVREL